MNISSIIEQVQGYMGTNDDDLGYALYQAIENTCNDICKLGDFWFAKIEPDLSFTENFPFTSATLASFNKQFSWLAQGWFVSGGSYSDLSIPVMSPYYVNDDGDSDHWSLDSVAELYSCTKYNIDGTNEGAINIVPYNSIIRQGDFGTDSVGDLSSLSFALIEDVHYLMLYPKPDTNATPYLYAVEYRTGNFKPLVGPESTNPIITHYPNLALNIGIMEAAKYYHNNDMYTTQYIVVYGPPEMQKKGGLVGELIKSNLNRQASAYDSLGMYRSKRAASGRYPPNTNIRQAISGGYYK